MRTDPNTAEIRANQDAACGEPKRCVPIKRFCKRGHLKTEATTFERKVTIKGKKYIVRECRQCHSIRNTPPPKTGRHSLSRWLERWQADAAVSTDQLGAAIEAVLAAREGGRT